MQFSDQFTLLATPAHLSLVKILLIVMFLLHLPYIGMFIGGSFFSVIFSLLGKRKSNKLHTTFARDLIDMVAFNKSIGIIMGALPLLVIALIYSQVLYAGNAVTLQYLIYSFLPIILGLIFVYIYKYTLRFEKDMFSLMGAFGVLLLLTGYFVFIASIARFHDPEKWGFIKNPIQVLTGWNAIGNYLAFLNGLQKAEEEVIQAAMTTMRKGTKKDRRQWFQKVKETTKQVRMAEAEQIYE